MYESCLWNSGEVFMGQIPPNKCFFSQVISDLCEEAKMPKTVEMWIYSILYKHKPQV